MKQTTARIISVAIIISFFTGLFLQPEPVSAGISEWSAETIPSTTGNMLGPDGTGNNLDVRDLAIGNDNKILYAVPGDSLNSTYKLMYKSLDAGVTWAAISTPARADLIAVAPDNNNIVAFANNSTPEVFLSIDGGTTWNSLNIAGAVPSPAGIADITISPERNGIHYIGVAGWEAGIIANTWYFNYGASFPSWQGTRNFNGFVSQNETAAMAFSPNFAADATMVIVTGNVSTGVSLQLFDLVSQKWNASAFYDDYPCAIVSANVSHLLSASVTLSPDFDGMDDTYRDLFIGLTIAGDSTAVAYSGIYRFRDTVKTSILTNKQVHSVDFNGSSLLAGMYNETTVYRVLTPLYTTRTIKTSTPTKNPGGEGKVLAAWLGNIVAAGTGGNESAFATSKDFGITFNDISLIDTKIANARDIAIPVNASKAHFVTDDGFDTSLWYKVSGTWTRVLSIKSSVGYIVRTEKAAANVVYLALTGGTSIYYNGSSGTAQWHNRTCNLNIRDIAVESATVVYALDAAGKVSKSINSGVWWNASVDTSLGSGNMLYSISAGKLLAGSKNGYIAYSLDGNTVWQKIPAQFDAGAGKMYAVPDQGFAANSVIYAATQTPGRNIMKWQIGVSTSWTDIFPGTVAGGVYGLAVDTNTLYALEYDPGTNQSSLWRFIAPLNATATAEGWTQVTTTAATDTDNPNVRLNAEPQALKASTNKLWAVKTNGVNKLYSFNDSVSDLTIIVQGPQDNYLSRVNSINGQVYDVAFSWKRPGVATDYELRISMDPEFSDVLASVNITSSAPVASVIIGPGQPGTRNVYFWPGMTYYWKIRTTKPGFSLFTAPRKFTIDATSVSFYNSIQLLSPVAGNINTGISPAFSWLPLQNTTEYEFMLSESVDMLSPLLDARVNNPGFQVPGELEPGKTYFWRVRATSPVESDWSPLGVFTVQAIAAPPPTVEGTTIITTIILPAETQTAILFPPVDTTSKEITPGYYLITIFVMLVLIALIIGIIIKNPGRISHAYASEGAVHIRRLKEKAENSEGRKPQGQPPAAKAGFPMPGETILPAALVPAPTNPVKPVELSTQKTDNIHGTDAPPALGKSKEAASVIFAAKSLMWMDATEKGTAESLTEKEKEALGKKLAGRIQALAKKEPLFIRHPEDAAMLLQIWARYGSRKDTDRYVATSLKSQPENALRLIKCYLPSDATSAGVRFNHDCYKALAEVADPGKIYAALSRLSKFKTVASKEGLQIKPAESNISAEFMRLHLEKKKSG